MALTEGTTNFTATLYGIIKVATTVFDAFRNVYMDDICHSIITYVMKEEGTTSTPFFSISPYPPS
jgi:hypothetical protein